jgi:hypothetical protein
VLLLALVFDRDFARMTRWSAITPTRDRRSALAHGSRSTTAADDNLNRLVHHQRGRYSTSVPLAVAACTAPDSFTVSRRAEEVDRERAVV